MVKDENKKPPFSMESTVQRELDRLGNFIDDAMLRAENGDLLGLKDWKSGIDSFYLNIDSFLEKDESGFCDDIIKKIDEIFNPMADKLPETIAGRTNLLKMLRELTRFLYHKRNDIFIKQKEGIKPRTM